jgi:hypothetical protein
MRGYEGALVSSRGNVGRGDEGFESRKRLVIGYLSAELAPEHL